MSTDAAAPSGSTSVTTTPRSRTSVVIPKSGFPSLSPSFSASIVKTTTSVASTTSSSSATNVSWPRCSRLNGCIATASNRPAACALEAYFAK
eukprot:3151292-Pleurochrysis_carterae.AAC.5